MKITKNYWQYLSWAEVNCCRLWLEWQIIVSVCKQKHYRDAENDEVLLEENVWGVQELCQLNLEWKYLRFSCYNTTSNLLNIIFHHSNWQWHRSDFSLYELYGRNCAFPRFWNQSHWWQGWRLLVVWGEGKVMVCGRWGNTINLEKCFTSLM